MPGRQLIEVTITNLLLIKPLGLFRGQSTGVGCCQSFRALRQTRFQLLRAELQKAGQLMPQSEAIAAKRRKHFGLRRCHGAHRNGRLNFGKWQHLPQ